MTINWSRFNTSLLVSLLLVPGSRGSRADEAVPVGLAAPVRVLSRAPREASAAMPAARPARRQPTLPGGKLPWYQLDHRRRALPSPERLSDSRIRFVLALPGRPIVVSAAITIDGQPFRLARQRRIEGVLDAAREPPRGEDGEGVPPPGGDTATTGVEMGEQESRFANAGDQRVEGGNAVSPAAAREPPYELATSAIEFVRRYRQATGAAASPAEVRWLIVNRLDGPAVLFLSDNFQRHRAEQRPGFNILDRDRGGTISGDELERAVQSLTECDLNRDGIVAAAEIADVAADPRWAEFEDAASGKLIIPWGDLALPGALSRLAARYGGEIPELRAEQPDLVLAVAFDTNEPGRSSIRVERHHPARNADREADVARTTITVPLAGARVAISGLQGGASDQISIGAVNDGYPLLPALDPNDDGRLTERELRRVVGQLREFDRDRDGNVTADELPVTIRVCLGLGPVVHQELAVVRSVHEGGEKPVVGPDWFVRMDRNGDGDLSRGEFPGTDEQFTALDADGDALVSAAEALRFDTAQSGER